MAKKEQEMLERAIKVAEEEKLYFMEDIIARLPISKKTFYNYKLHEVPELKEITEKNKIAEKLKLRKNWAKSTNATLNIALYKLLATNEERRILSDNEMVVTFKDLPTNIDDLSDEEIERLYEEQTNGTKKANS